MKSQNPPSQHSTEQNTISSIKKEMKFLWEMLLKIVIFTWKP